MEEILLAILVILIIVIIFKIDVLDWFTCGIKSKFYGNKEDVHNQNINAYLRDSSDMEVQFTDMSDSSQPNPYEIQPVTKKQKCQSKCQMYTVSPTKWINTGNPPIEFVRSGLYRLMH